MPRFVILQHEPPPNTDRKLHWDLMLEESETLRTWSLAAPPADGESTVARSLPDHRKAYLDYEGPVSRNRGSVARWDFGHFRWHEQNDTTLVCTLDGQRLRGRLVLSRRDASAESWKATFEAAE
jgi:hypothetical protein